MLIDDLLVSLTSDDNGVSDDNNKSPSRIGGKASSLAKLYAMDGLSNHVPTAFALTVDFFAPWIESLTHTEDFLDLKKLLNQDVKKSAIKLCQKLQALSLQLPFSDLQSKVIVRVLEEMNSESWASPKLAAVRSSAPEEDGASASFAGAFETKLGVANTQGALETAIRSCFASLWDYRVWNYRHQQQNLMVSTLGFCVVIMEMVDSVKAGVAFSANPLNSDRDELVIDSSWGLGESVVDGTVVADRYIVEKGVSSTGIDFYSIQKETIGHKETEKRLDVAGGTITQTVAEADRERSSLDIQQIQELAQFVCIIEEHYGMPMDVEWAFVKSTAGEQELKLLQARPITTLYHLDPKLMTKKGERRRLYFDMNVISEATTTNPFTTLDMDLYCRASATILGATFEDVEEKNFSIFSNDPEMYLINASTRQYVNVSTVLNFLGKDTIAKGVEVLDSYSTSIIQSKDFDPKRYRASRWIPKGVTMRKIYNFFSVMNIIEYYKKGKKYTHEPIKQMKVYRDLVAEDMANLQSLEEKDFMSAIRNKETGLFGLVKEFWGAMSPSLTEECAAIEYSLMALLQELDEKRRNGDTEEIRQDYEALCGGFEGDELMEMNIALYRLAQALPESIWNEYEHSDMEALAARIRNEEDLPPEFLNAWKDFMNKYDFDGQDQMFISCPRYEDKPELLLQKLKLNAMGSAEDPSIAAIEKTRQRHKVQLKHEAEAFESLSQKSWPFRYFARKKLAKIQKRNEMLDHVAWIRNAPKLHIAKVIGKLRRYVLLIENEMIQNGLLEEQGDVFHLSIAEIDLVLKGDDDTFHAMELVRSRKAVFTQAKESHLCPLFVDSRCRILQPDPPSIDGVPPEPGTLVGTAISPGIATGKVRIVHSPSDPFEPGEILCAVVTGPAWTPLFASASAVVLQIGGLLQHGALCAREYHKPAVSTIDVNSLLHDGMLVEVDGNTGIVKILGPQ